MSLDIEQRAGPPTLHALPRGPRVALRPAGPADLDGLRSLAAKGGVVCEDLELARLVRSDPAHRVVLCATALQGGVETVLGIGVIELGRSATQPSLLLVDTELTDGLGRLLADALVARARQLSGPQVA